MSKLSFALGILVLTFALYSARAQIGGDKSRDGHGLRARHVEG